MSVASFRIETNLRAGDGASLIAAEHAREAGVGHATVILDGGLRDNEAATRLIDALREAAETVDVAENDVAEPSYDDLDEFRTRVNPKTELIVGVGGGSTLDLTKAISLLLTNTEPAIAYRGFDLPKNPGPPVIAIPTTAGTGSEVTPNAVFTDKAEGRKFGINTHLYLPVLALLDPLMTVSAPRSVTVSAGMDALVHAVESYVARAANSVTRGFSREGFRRVMRWLPQVVKRPDDLEARLELQIGALFAGAGLMNSGAGPAAALSYPLGARFMVPHGIAGGVFLAPIAIRNVDEGAEVYAGLAELLPDPPPRDAPAIERSRAVVDAIAELAREIEVPGDLGPFGIGRDDVDLIVEQAWLTMKGALDMNPVPVDEGGLRSLLEEMTV